MDPYTHTKGKQRREYDMTANPLYGTAKSIPQKEFHMTRNELYNTVHNGQLQRSQEDFKMTQNQTYKRASVISHDA